MTEQCPAEFLRFAEHLASASGGIIRPYFRQKIVVDDKADATPVTIADREAESAMRSLIEKRYPEHGIYGEEHGITREGAEYMWVLDPIDGTKSFISGIPLFGTLIALTRAGRPILGIVDQPVSGERWIGAVGHPAMLNRKTVSTRSCAELARASLFATSPDLFVGWERDAFERLRARAKLTRYGTDCYAPAMLAAGFIDLVVEVTMKPYDYCALVPLIEAAGGVITDWSGQPLDLDSDGRIVAAGDVTLHAKALALLRDQGADERA